MLFMCKEEDKSHLNKSLGFQKLGPLNYDSTTSIGVSFGRSGSFRADLRSKALISSTDLKAGQIVLANPLFLRSCPVAGNVALGTEQSQEFPWLQETEVKQVPWP